MTRVDGAGVRRSPDRLVGGVCAGIAEYLGVDPLIVRLAAVVLTLATGLGLAAYLVAWWLVPLDRRPRPALDREPSPWLAALQRDDPRTIIGAGCLGIGAVVLLRSAGLLADSVVTVAATLVAAGIAVAWVRTSPEDRDRLLDAAARAPGSPRALLRGGPGSVARLALGSVLVLGGAFAILAAADAVDDAGTILLAAAVTTGGLALLLGPWIVGLRHVVGEERRARIRSEERADLAAELHDSVLQTLALIQRSAPTRPAEAVALARRQERELRSWLYGDGRALRSAGAAATLTEALGAVAAEVEADHGVEIEVVAVGDHPLDFRADALVGRGAGGARQRRPSRRGAVGRPLRRGRRGHRHGVRAGPRPGLRSHRHAAGRSPRHHRVDPGPDGARRGSGDDHDGTGWGHRGGARDRGEPAMSDAKVRTFLVDDHRLFLSGVQSELEGKVEIVGSATDVETAVAGIVESEPEVVLLDVHLPGGGGLAVLRAVLPVRPDVRFLALSVSDAAEDVIGVIRGGARGYVTKTIAPDELVAAVERVRDGDAVFSPRLAGFVLDAFAGDAPAPAPDPDLEQLTPRSGRSCASSPAGTPTASSRSGSRSR